MARLLKNLIPSENCSNSSYKDTSVNILLTTLKRENSTGRLSHRSSTAEIRKKNAKNNLTPINDRSSKPPYLSIKDYLEGKNKKKILITPITPLKNDKNSNSKNINKDSLEDNNTQKKIIGKNEDQKLIIKEIKEDIIGKSQPSKSEMQKIKNEECKKIPDFFVKVNINIENNLNNSEDNEGKKNLKLKKEMIKNSDMVNIKNDLDKRKNLIENLKNSDKKIEQLLNSQMKNTNITTSLNVTQEKNKNEISSKTSNKFFELSNNLTPAKRGEEKKTNKIENQITEQIKNEKLINFLKTEEIFMKDQPNNVISFFSFFFSYLFKRNHWKM